MQQRTLRLTAEQRTELERTRDRDHRAYLREIAAALLKIADGMAPYAVARHGLYKRRQPDTVYRWLNAYQRQGLAGVIHRPRGHRGISPPAGRGAAGGDPAAARPVRDRPAPLAAGRSAAGAPLPGGL